MQLKLKLKLKQKNNFRTCENGASDDTFVLHNNKKQKFSVQALNIKTINNNCVLIYYFI